ncbi:MAG TPA: diguanylate cyclase [Burkholderiales bacterium]|nr:diguanylate cyclase [Burkholderiales bacterium]
MALDLPPLVIYALLAAALAAPALAGLALARRRETARLRALLDSVPAPIAHVDADEGVRFANSACEEWFDRERSAIVGRPLRELFGKSAYDAARPFVAEAQGGRHATFEAELPAARGRTRHAQVTLAPAAGAAQRSRGFTLVLAPIDALKAMERELRRLAHYDALTGAANRVAFDDHLWRSLARARRTGALTAVMHLDIDRFKEVNARLGRAAGDEILRDLTLRLRASLRATDTIGRFGGDHFAVVLESIGGRLEAEQVARKVLAAIRKPLAFAGQDLVITTSIGIAIAGHDAAPEQLMRDAETALAWAKSGGRNTSRVIEHPIAVTGAEIRSAAVRSAS